MSNRFYTILIILILPILPIVLAFPVEALSPNLVATPPAKLIVPRQNFAKLRGNITSLGAGSFVLDGKTINIGPGTKILRKFGAKSSLAEFSVNDDVMVVGLWTDVAKTAVNASVVRNFSIQKRHGVFFGIVKSLKPETAELVISTLNRGDLAVTPTTSTTYVNRQDAAIVFNTLRVGHRVRVKGLWDNKLNTLTEVAKIKDFSLPPLPETSTNATSSANQ